MATGTGPLLYPLTMCLDDDGRILAQFPDIPMAATDGADRMEALREAQDCLDTAVAALIRANTPLPTPSRPARGQPTLAPNPALIAKSALRQAMAAQGIGTSELARRIGIGESAARRLCDPFCRSKIDSLALALDALGLHIVASVEPKAA